MKQKHRKPSTTFKVGKMTVMEQPLLNSLDDYFGSGKTAEKRIGGLLGSFVPAIAAAVADIADDEARDNSRWFSGINRIPGARNYNDKAKKPREKYLQNRTNRIIDKFDPLNFRPAGKKKSDQKTYIPPTVEPSKIKPFANFQNVRQSENVEDLRGLERSGRDKRLQRWLESRRSENIIDKRAGTVVNGYVEALISGDKKDIENWKKEVSPQSVTPVEMEYIREMENKYLKSNKKKFIPPTVKR